MKTSYLKEIRVLLQGYKISESEINDIINDYSTMYDDGLARGLSDEEVINHLGKAEKVVAELGENYPRKERHAGTNKIIALMPFLCTIAFFLLGMAGYWHPGWMVFLLIPVTAIFLSMYRTHDKHLLTALSPFIATVIFLCVGLFAHIWHPTWMIFLAIPVIAILNSSSERKPISTITALSPFAAVIGFFFLGQAGYWNPGWLIFLAIPMIGILNSPKKTQAFFFEVTFLAAIGIYLFLGYQYHRWDLGLIGFLIPVAYGFLIQEIKINFFGNSWPTRIAAILAIAIYLTCGFLFQSWAYLWLLFLAIPVVAILTSSKRKDWIVAISPFVAVTIFFVLGYFFHLWAYSWIAFMIIPIAGILKDK